MSPGRTTPNSAPEAESRGPLPPPTSQTGNAPGRSAVPKTRVTFVRSKSRDTQSLPPALTSEGGPPMRLTIPRLLRPTLLSAAGLGVLLYVAGPGATQPKSDKPVGKTSYDQVSPALVGQVSFEEMMAKDKEAKPAIMARQKALLEERYDLTARPHDTIKMTRGKPIPVGPTAKLSDGMTFEKLAEMISDDIRDKGVFPK